MSDPEPERGSGSGSANPIPAAPPPWTLTGDVYTFAFWTSASQARRLPDHAFSPLEARHPAAGPRSDATRARGGLGMVQIIRYRDSPVGPYDELILLPGRFDWVREAQGGRPAAKGSSARISRIYVSQRDTCYNGRVNWNVPKHLARFDWATRPDGTTAVAVFPHDTGPRAHADESRPAAQPFFRASFAALPYAPRFPASTAWARPLGLDTTLVLPPLPAGAAPELPGTADRWCAVRPEISSRSAALGWFDLQQGEGAPGGFEHFWPGWGRWKLGVKMEDATILFPEPEIWHDTPKSVL